MHDPVADPSVDYGRHQIRAVWHREAPYFVAEDVIEALGLSIGPKTPVDSRIDFLREGSSRATLPIPSPSGPVALAVLSAHGIKQLCAKRNSKTALKLSKFLAGHAARVTPRKPKVLKASDDRPDGPLPLNGVRVRFVTIDGLPWYSLADFAYALCMNADLAARDMVPAVHMRTAAIPQHDGRTEDALVLSPIGAWQLALQEKDRLRTLAHRWVFKETQLIEPKAFDRTIHGAPQMMALLPSGEVPPRPHPKSGRVFEWEYLRCSDEAQTYSFGRPCVVRALVRTTE